MSLIRRLPWRFSMTLADRQARHALDLPRLVPQSLLLSQAHAGVEPALSLLLRCRYAGDDESGEAD
jgi:hypothetical protein